MDALLRMVVIGLGLLLTLLVVFVAWQRSPDSPETNGDASPTVDENIAASNAVGRPNATATHGQHVLSVTEKYPVGLAPNAAEHVRRFGEVHAEPFKNEDSLFFLAGRYIASPYRVSRVGLGVYLNGRLLWASDWPGRYYIAEEPAMPTGLTRSSTIADVAEPAGSGPSWKSLTFRYLHSHFAPDQADEKYYKALRQLPFVKQAGLEPHPEHGFPCLKVVTHSGEIHYEFMSEGSDFRPDDPDVVLAEVKAHFTSWQNNLRLPGLWWDGILHSPFSEEWRSVPEVVEILESQAAAADKAQRLYPLLHGSWGGEVRQQLELRLQQDVANFETSTQLKSHVKTIRKKREEWQREQEKKNVPPTRQPRPGEPIARLP